MRSLRSAKAREESKCFLAEGITLCKEAVRDRSVTMLLVDQEKKHLFAQIIAQAKETLIVPAHIVAYVCETKTPQGIAAVVSWIPPLEIEYMQNQSLLVLDGVQDPGNVGTMLRTAEAMAFGGCILSETCADVYAPKTVRASMGSVLRLPTLRTALPQMLCRLQEGGYCIIGAAHGGKPLQSGSLVYTPPFALVIGSEGKGLSKEVTACVDECVSITMAGKVESLNAAVAASILMFALHQQD